MVERESCWYCADHPEHKAQIEAIGNIQREAITAQQSKHPNETVTSCPRCNGGGRHLKPNLPPRTFVDLINDYMKCEMCDGSGKVFVVPARVIGPAPR